MSETGALYQKRIPIYTRSVKGKFRNFKTSVLVLAFTIFFGLPWLPWHRSSAAAQVLMFDLESRRFFIFDLVVYPQDIFWLALLLFIAAAFLFFVTGLVGRAWCGYFCFQTLWLDCFMFIEHFFQGERPARMRLAKQPWNAEKIMKVGGSHLVMLLVSFWTGFTFVAYFTYAPDFFINFFHGAAHPTAYFSVLTLTLTTYAAGGVAREHICTYICPYARFQSVMYEQDTLAPSYDLKRGERAAGRIAPKAGIKTQEERQAKGHGDCIDCGFCVQVCPTGVDIRKGLQYQCISCGLCVDACNTIMDSLGWKRGLIRYDSERNVHSPAPAKPQLKWKNLKVVGYASALIVMTAALVYNIGTRSDAEVRISQVRQPLFIHLSDEKIRNRYEVHIVNKTEHDESYTIKVHGIPEEALNMGVEPNPMTIRAGKDRRIPVKVDLDEHLAEKTREFDFVIVTKSNPETQVVRSAHFNAEHQENDEQH
jgi:cytochrome c oxidase accessory protein FixG